MFVGNQSGRSKVVEAGLPCPAPMYRPQLEARPKILILTSHTGGGHLNQAQSLKEELSARYEVEIVDPHPRFIHSHYTLLSRHFLKIWDWEYTFFDNRLGSLAFHQAITLLTQRRLTSVLQQMKPQLIITVHALISYEVARVLKRTSQSIPLVFHLTDLGETHTTWFTENNANAYLAPTREIFDQALAKGIDANRLHITGRRVRRQFLSPDVPGRREVLSSLELNPDIFTIFLQGGAKGAAGIDRTLESIFTAEKPVQIILAVGNNASMAARFAGMKNVRALPFTETIAPYMAAADVIAGKAGASFLTEAFILEKPFLVTAFIPGQEEPNLAFIERYNLGWVALESALQRQLIAKIVSNPAVLAEKVSSIQAYKAWNISANANLLPIIEGLLA